MDDSRSKEVAWVRPDLLVFLAPPDYPVGDRFCLYEMSFGKETVLPLTGLLICVSQRRARIGGSLVPLPLGGIAVWVLCSDCEALYAADVMHGVLSPIPELPPKTDDGTLTYSFGTHVSQRLRLSVNRSVEVFWAGNPAENFVLAWSTLGVAAWSPDGQTSAFFGRKQWLGP